LFKNKSENKSENNGILKKKGLNKGLIVAIIIIAFGTFVGVYSYNKINETIRPDIEMINVPVPRGNIQVYTNIGISDFYLKAFPKDVGDNNFIMDINEFSGKTTIQMLDKDVPVVKESLVNTTERFNNKRIVSINMDPTRASGAKPGDVVDLYFLSNDPKGEAEMIISRAKVIDVCDQNGKSLYEEASSFRVSISPSSSSGTLIYRLVIDNEDVSKALAGSNPKSHQVSFSKHIGR